MRLKQRGWLVLGGCFLLLVAGCLSTGAPSTVVDREKLVWPGPPDPARIVWEREITGPLSFDIHPAWWQRLGAALFGQEQTGWLRPYGLLADEQHQRLLVVDTEGGALHLFDLKAQKYKVLRGADEPLLVSPVDVAVDPLGTIYLTDSVLGQIYVIDAATGDFQPLLARELDRPTGLVFNPADGLLYVSETGAHQLVAIDRQGVEVRRFGGRGEAPGQFNFPTDLWIDAQGRLLVTDSLNGRIQIVSTSGEPLVQLGQAGDSQGYLAKPKGVAVDSEGHIYVADALQDMVQVYDEQGRLLLTFGTRGQRPGEFWMPSGLYIDSRDNIYVTDTYNRRLQVFSFQSDRQGREG
jgi:DNA-binding beta-propeller fold protein YncE